MKKDDNRTPEIDAAAEAGIDAAAETLVSELYKVQRESESSKRKEMKDERRTPRPEDDQLRNRLSSLHPQWAHPMNTSARRG